MKLVYVQWTNNFGGLEKISQLYEKIFAAYCPLIIILRYNEGGLKYKNYLALRKKNKLLFIIEYFFIARKNRNSVFHIQYAGSTILLLTFLAGVKKVVFHFHGTKLPQNNRLIWKLLEKKVVIIANSFYMEEVIKKKLKLRNKIHLIPNLIDLKTFKYAERTYNGGEFNISFVGRFDPGKNIKLILESAKIIKSKDTDVKFIIAGDGPEKENIRKKIEEYSLESIVKLIPFTKDILKIYYDSHLLIFLSLYESFGNVVAEAILTGLPVLCYKIQALEELIGDDIFFVDTQDPEVIANKMLYMKENFNLVCEKLRILNENVKQYLDNESIVKKLDSIYQNFNDKN